MLGSTVYTFSIILAVFLIGLGVGSAPGPSSRGANRAEKRPWAGAQLPSRPRSRGRLICCRNRFPTGRSTDAAINPWLKFQSICAHCLGRGVAGDASLGREFSAGARGRVARISIRGESSATLRRRNAGRNSHLNRCSACCHSAVRHEKAGRLLSATAIVLRIVGLCGDPGAAPPLPRRSESFDTRPRLRPATAGGDRAALAVPLVLVRRRAFQIFA